MYSRKEVFVPFSGRRFIVTSTGRLLDSNKKELSVETIDKEQFVEIDWVLGRRKYLLALIILVSYGTINLPCHLFDKVEILYRDDDVANLTPQNLLYRFLEPIEVEDYEGFYYIPFYNNYAISKNGDLININTGKYKSWSITSTDNNVKNQKGGYRYSRVINDHGFSKCLFLHRALCLVFKKYESNVFSIVVNHKDGAPGNNAINNLEWSTYKDNNLHALAMGLRSDNRPILSKNIQTGEIKSFTSIGECGRYYNAPRAGFIQHRLKFSKDKVYSDYLLFKYDDGTPWPSINLDKVKIERVGRIEMIEARNVFTGDIILFEGAPKGCYLTGVKKATILNHTKNGHQIPCMGWNFKWASDKTPWPVHTARHLKVYEKFPIFPPTAAIVFNTETKEETFFESVALACQKLNIDKSLFSNYCKTGKLLKNLYELKYFNLKKSLGHPIE